MSESIKNRKKILIIDSWLHDKNKQGLNKVLQYLHGEQQIEYNFGSIADIPNYDTVYSPSQAINSSLYPNQKFIFGPHFSTFPAHKQLETLQNNKFNNSIYVQPSEWVVQLWKNMGAEQYLSIKSLPFSVDTNKFAPTNKDETENTEKTEVFVYHKDRHPRELEILKSFLNYKKITYKLFDYAKKYNEIDYLQCLKNAKYGIWLGRHESQGFALEEALSMNVPLLVWETKFMSQEYGYNYNDIPCSTIPYWDKRCGEFFYNYKELEETFNAFQTKLKAKEYSPRQYIMDNLSSEKCAERLMELI